jgi:AraC-like DNA-binding protein
MAQEHVQMASRRPFVGKDMPYSVRRAFYRNLETIYTEVGGKNPSYDTIVLGAITQLIGLFLRHGEVYKDQERADLSTENKISYVLESINYIHNNYHESINLKGLAGHVGISESYLSRLFHRVTGMTFKEYVNRVRIEKAEYQICFTDRKMIDIAMECGYNNLRTFNREFLFVKNKRPSDLRKTGIRIGGKISG